MARCPTSFPYVPGLLAFRELPAVLAALARLKITPYLILCDGQGIAHPRRFGFASHLGVLLDVPTIGAAKTRLTGHHDEPPNVKGAWTPLIDGAETIGAVVRTRAGVKPLYVSIGHRVCLETAIELTLACVTRSLAWVVREAVQAYLVTRWPLLEQAKDTLTNTDEAKNGQS